MSSFSSISPGSPGSFSLEKVFKNQVLVAGSVHCYLGITASSPSVERSR